MNRPEAVTECKEKTVCFFKTNRGGRSHEDTAQNQGIESVADAEAYLTSGMESSDLTAEVKILHCYEELATDSRLARTGFNKSSGPRMLRHAHKLRAATDSKWEQACLATFWPTRSSCSAANCRRQCARHAFLKDVPGPVFHKTARPLRAMMSVAPAQLNPNIDRNG